MEPTCGGFSQRFLRLTVRGWLSWLPQAAEEHPGDWLLDSCKEKLWWAVNALSKEHQVGCAELAGLQYCNVIFAIEKELAYYSSEGGYAERLASAGR